VDDPHRRITPLRNRPVTQEAADTQAVTAIPVAADTRTAALTKSNSCQLRNGSLRIGVGTLASARGSERYSVFRNGLPSRDRKEAFAQLILSPTSQQGDKGAIEESATVT
jgi:hypothetical protein